MGRDFSEADGEPQPQQLQAGGAPGAQAQEPLPAIVILSYQYWQQRYGGSAAILGRRLRNLVVITEVALSFVLLIGSGLMIRSFIALQRIDLGYDPHNVLTFFLQGSGGAQPQERSAFMRELQGRLRALPGVGLYGVLSNAVRQRTAEIGVRMALGATPGSVFKLIVGHGLRLSAIGLAAGMVAAFKLTRAMTSMLVGVKATDPATFTAMAALFLIIAAIASGLPARRAAHVDPLVALRHE